jgi:hypothetical protein
VHPDKDLAETGLRPGQLYFPEHFGATQDILPDSAHRCRHASSLPDHGPAGYGADAKHRAATPVAFGVTFRPAVASQG